MTDNNHPITPPPELVQQWASESLSTQTLCTQAALWGADQELEECVEWIVKTIPSWAPHTFGEQLRAARRPKPPSLKEQATFAAAVLQSPDETCSIAEITEHWRTIRRAIESLPD